VGGGTDQVVEAGQGRGVPGDLQPGGADPGRAAVVVEPDFPGGPGLVLGLGLRGGVEQGRGLGDQPLDPRRAARVGDRGELRVDVRRRLSGQAMGQGGDPARPPRRDPQLVDPGLDPREPVAQVQAVGHQLHRGPRRDAEAGVQRLHAPGPDQRRPVSADGLLGVPQVGVGPVRGLQDVGDDVSLGPVERQPQLAALCFTRLRLGLADELQHDVVGHVVHDDRRPRTLHVHQHDGLHARRGHRQSCPTTHCPVDGLCDTSCAGSIAVRRRS
jgi:hypothetical protein